MPLSTINSNSFSSTANTNIDNGNLFIDAINNRIGIGTTTPAYSLQVQRAGQSNMSILNSSNSVELRMIADTAGAYVQTNTNHPLWFATNNGAVQMAIDTSGRVTKPYIPAFSVRGAQTGSVSGGSQFTFTDSTTGASTQVVFNNGSYWNNSTSLFTAPVAGYYQFNFNVYQTNAATAASVAVRLNGSEMGTTDIFGKYSGSLAGGDNGITLSYMVKMAAGDTTGLYVRAGFPSLSVYAGHSWFQGYLIG